jgi:chromosome partitioning protein
LPQVIAILNQKGGVGKTTLAVHLATAFTRKGRRVLLIDADSQGSALDWGAARQGELLFPVVGLPKKSIHKELPALAKDFDLVVIDGPPRVNEVAQSAILASDLVLIPVQPSPYDVWAAKDIMDLLNEASVYKPSLKSAFTINRKIANTAIGRDVNDALASYPVPVLKSAICQRVPFAESAAQGLTVFELDPEMLASQEMMQLADEVEEMLNEESDVRSRQAQ